MKKAFSVLIGAAAALVLGTFSSAAEDISIEPKFADETADGETAPTTHRGCGRTKACSAA